MSIRIVTDSTCDLPKSVVEEHRITVSPLYINVGGQSYLDGVDLSREEFYTQLPSYSVPPTTAVPGHETFARTYRTLAEDGASEILSLHISPSLSGMLDVARIAAAEVSEIVQVSVLDSRQLSLGLGFSVLAAARAAADGHSMDQILALLEDQIPRTRVFAALDTMEYLRRSGRVNHLVANIGNLLRIKPLLIMNDGVASSERVRTQQGAYGRLVQLVRDLGPLEELALVHTNAPDRAEALWMQARTLYPHISEPLSVDVTPVLGTHLGPGAVGFAAVAAAGSEGERDG
jgi:DegV family protein with EDD domain